MQDEAAKAVEQKSDYVRRGRAHGDLSDGELGQVFVYIFHELARSSSFEFILPQLHDVEAEYRLRKLDPPYVLVRRDAEIFIRRISDAVGSVDCGGDV